MGDLLNPVYATLDELLVASGQPPRFPRIENQSITFLRGNEQETKLVLEQPIYEPRLGPAVAASRAEVDRSTANLDALRARVVRDTHQAYYLWLATQQAVLVLEATLELAQANLAANESLYRNGKITRDLVLRAEADLLEVEQQRISAASRVRITQGYVNLLRNAPLGGSPAACRDRRAHRRALPRAARSDASRRGRWTRRRCSRWRPAAGRSSRASTPPSPAARRARTSPAPRSDHAWRSAPRPASRATTTTSARTSATPSPP